MAATLIFSLALLLSVKEQTVDVNFVFVFSQSNKDFELGKEGHLI
jgi:hypothetical protein